MQLEEIVEAEFVPFSDILRAHGSRRGDAIAMADETSRVSWAELDATVDRVAAALQRDGVQPGEPVAMVGANSVNYALAFLGAVRAGGIATPLTRPKPLLRNFSHHRHRVFAVLDAERRVSRGPSRAQLVAA